jgi:hypothetical protein
MFDYSILENNSTIIIIIIQQILIKTHGWRTLPKCGDKCYHHIIGPYFGKSPHPRAILYKKNILLSSHVLLLQLEWPTFI